MNSLNLDPNKVFSTGQRLDDFIKLSKLYAPDAASMSTAQVIPPVLVDPNYIPPNRAPVIIVGHILPLALALACVVMRLYSRIRRFGKNGLLVEDYLILFALMIVIVLAAMSIFGAVHLQQGYEVTDLTAHSLSESLRMFYGTTFLYPLATCTIRVSLVLFFRRIYDRTGSRMIMYCNVILVLCFCVFISAEFAFGFECIPVRASWDIWVRNSARCEILNITFANSLATMILDFMILLVPLSFISAVKGGWLKKVEVYLLFGIGIIAWSANILGLWEFRFHYGQWKNTIDAELCYFSECVIGIVCSCAPAIRNLFPSTHTQNKVTFRVSSGRVVKTVKKSRPSARSSRLTDERDLEFNDRRDGSQEGGFIDDEAFDEMLSPRATWWGQEGTTTRFSTPGSSTGELVLHKEETEGSERKS